MSTLAPASLLAPWTRRLIARVENSKANLVVLRGIAGSGKSILLQSLSRRHSVPVRRDLECPSTPDAVLRDGITLVDYGTNAPSLLNDIDPVQFSAIDVKVVIACRPGTCDAALDRLQAYDCADTIRPRELFLTPEEAASFGHGSTRAFVRSGGWPWLFHHLLEGDTDERVVARFIERELLETIDPGNEILISALTRQKRGLRDSVLSSAERDFLRDLEPVLRLDETGCWRWAVPGLASIVRKVAEERLADQSPANLVSYSHKLHVHGAVDEAVRTAQLAGDDAQAARWLAENGGPWFGHFFGSAAFSRILSGFGTCVGHREVIGLSSVMQALKAGRVDRARWLLSEHFGSDALSLEKVLDPDEPWTAEMRVFRLVMAIYEQTDPEEDLVERAYHVLARLPDEDHLQRGLFYNAMIEFYLRQRRLSEARAVSRRALFHYRAANAPYLAFFIHLFEAIISLMDGRADDALRSSNGCVDALRKSRIASAADWRIQKLLHGCIDYERGDPETLVRFIDQDMESFSFGELWPTLGELCLLYGAQALAEAASPANAHAFLDRWRVEVARSGRFRTVAALHEIRLLQARHHWFDASQRLEALPAIDLDEARFVSDRHELAILLTRLRQRAYEDPLDPDVVAALKGISENPRLTARQALALSLWEAFTLMRARRYRAARDLVELTLEKAAQRNCIAPVLEERSFIQEILANRRIGRQIKLSEPARSLLARLRASQPGVASATTTAGVTRREMRILRLVAEGCTNKEAARAAGISAATVKFHLSNCYRKLAVDGRREAIAVARSRGWCD